MYVCLYALSELVSGDNRLIFAAKNQILVLSVNAYIDMVYAFSNRLCVENTQFKEVLSVLMLQTCFDCFVHFLMKKIGIHSEKWTEYGK